MGTENPKSAGGMLLSGVLASEAFDSSGEVLDIKGMDLSILEEGRGIVNYEHHESEEDTTKQEEKDHGAEVVGRILSVKKIFDEDDCSDDDQRRFWKLTKVPFVYGISRLYDKAGHEGAKALAANIRDAVANEDPLILGWSIEGTTLKREGHKLASTIARAVALTSKPCNKTAVAGLLLDPNAPEGFSKNPNNTKIYLKNEDPLRQRLGGSEIEYSAEMLKAMSAGSYNAAPGTLTGGAALQVEDKTLKNKTLKSMALAAKRDWNKMGKFRDHLKATLEKANLHDVSDEFLDHFSDLVEANHLRIKKSEEVLSELKAAGKTPKTPKTSKPKMASPEALTNNGEPVKPNKKLTEPKFDENKGILHMPQGSFKVYVPGHDTPEIASKFHEILNDPKVDAIHNYAMENWSKAHQLLKAGQLPPEVAMHAVLFSNLSPNTPVSSQELMYGHLVDAMKTTGQTPLTEKWQDVKNDWLDRDQPQKFPDHSPEHWKRLESALRIKHNSKITGRLAGDIGSFMLANDKFDNMTKYKDMHSKLQDLLQRHGSDTRSAVEEMMHHKNEQGKWNSRRRVALKSGKEDIGDYPGMSIAGLAPKTSRYALAMMGGGNIHVPDTHFTRNLFGLNRQKDGNSIDAIKNVMWEPRNTHILNGIDRYYAKNHDAVQHMLNHPRWGHLFKDNPENAVFPAFWKHWMAIVPHEKARGHTVNGYNELTDHKPFWEAIGPYIKKSDSPDSIPMQTAKQHAEWQLQYGEMPALLLYFRHLLPKLLASAAPRQAQSLIRKAQSVQIEVLSKADGSEPAPAPKPKTVTFQNRQVKPGKAFLHHSHGADAYHLVGQSPTHLFGIKESDDKSIHEGWTPDEIHKIPRESNDLEVKSYPETQDEPLVVNADSHGVSGFVNHPETRKMVHGFDFGQKTSSATGGAFARDSFWSKDPSGNHVYVKAASDAQGDTTEGTWNTARREGAYHNLAKDFFGLGKYMPSVAVVRHPATGKEHAIIQHIPGQHEQELSENQKINALKRMNKNGDMHKVAAMNFILNNNDRHAGNYLYTGKDKHDGLALIDHNMFGIYSPNKWREPSYLAWANSEQNPDIDIMQKMHPEAQKWLQGLDEGELRNHLMKNGMPQKGIDVSVERLKNLKKESLARPFHTAMKASMPNFKDTFSGDKTPPRNNQSSPDSQSPTATSDNEFV